MAVPAKPISTTPPPSDTAPLSDEEAMRLLNEALDEIDISEAPTAEKKTEEPAARTNETDPMAIAWTQNKRMMALARISPNLLRSVIGMEGKVSIVNCQTLLGIPLPISSATRLFQSKDSQAIEQEKQSFHQVTFPRLQTLPQDQVLPAIEHAIDEIIQRLLEKGAIKEVSPEQGATLLEGPFPLLQHSSPISKNKERLEGLGIPEASPEYQLMLRDPHLPQEIEIANSTLYARDQTFERGAKKAMEQCLAAYREPTSEAEQKELMEKAHRMQELEFKKFLDQEFAWGRFFLQRRDLLVSQYQGREVKTVALPSSNPLERLPQVSPSQLKLQDIELYKKDPKLLRALKEGEKTGTLINAKNLGFPIQSESGLVRIKDMDKLQQIGVQLFEGVQKDGMGLSLIPLVLELQSLIVPLSHEELSEQVTLMNQLMLSETPLDANVKTLGHLGILKSDELYEVLSKDPRLETEMELAEIGVCVKDASIAEIILEALGKFDISSLASKIGSDDLQAAHSAMQEGYKKVLDEKLGTNKDDYDRLLVETLKELYRARLGQ